jgi:hypothetical protein
MYILLYKIKYIFILVFSVKYDSNGNLQKLFGCNAKNTKHDTERSVF